MRTFLAAWLTLSLVVTGCASASGGRLGSGPKTDPTVWADYARNIPIGSRVRVESADGRTLKGTLMRVDSSSLVVNPATRIPEAPIEVPLRDVRVLGLDRSGGVAKAIVIGALAGVGATFGVLFLLFAMVGD